MNSAENFIVRLIVKEAINNSISFFFLVCAGGFLNECIPLVMEFAETFTNYVVLKLAYTIWKGCPLHRKLKKSVDLTHA